MANPLDKEQNNTIGDINPSLLLRETPRLIEQQHLSSKLWNVIRFEINHGREDGIYIVPIGSLKN